MDERIITVEDKIAFLKGISLFDRNKPLYVFKGGMDEKEARIQGYLVKGYLTRRANPNSRSDYLLADLCGQDPETAMRDVRTARKEIIHKIDTEQYTVIKPQKRYVPVDKEKMAKWKAVAAVIGLAATVAFANFIANNVGNKEVEPRRMGEPVGFREQMRVRDEDLNSDAAHSNSSYVQQDGSFIQYKNDDYGER